MAWGVGTAMLGLIGGCLTGAFDGLLMLDVCVFFWGVVGSCVRGVVRCRPVHWGCWDESNEQERAGVVDPYTPFINSPQRT